MEAQPVIDIRNASFSYDGPLVLEKVNLSIASRDFVGIVGPNGGGKTTLVKMLLGLIVPQEGRVNVLGQPPSRVRKRIGYMPQYVTLDMEFPVSVFDVVLMGRLGRGYGLGPYSKADKKSASRVLEEVGLRDIHSRPFSDISGGQRQRVLIARALACDPELLLLDEPTANLDPAIQDELYGLLRTLNERLTVVVVSHDIGFVSLNFNTVVCVNQKVHTHPRNELTQKQVADMYGREVRLLHPGQEQEARQ
jgi:zinc transport system ATP-binding protein